MRRTLAACLVTLLAPLAAAHEFWLFPSTFQPEPGAAFAVTLNHGERLAGHTVPRDEANIKRFELRTNASEPSPVFGMSGGDRSYAKTAAPNATLVYETEWMTNILPATKFNAYLAEEGLAAIVEMRTKAGENHAEGRERYMRCAKALLGTNLTDSPVGLPCEIVLADPESDQIRASVLFQGKPLAGITVAAVSQADPGTLYRATTDAKGTVAFERTHTGPLLLTTLHMQRVPAEAVADAGVDWESYWASLAFNAAE